MNILITTAGRRTYIIDYFKQALGNSGKIFASNSIYTYALSHADEYVITPSFYSKEYIATIIDVCKKKAIGAIISLLDADAKVLSEHHDQFRSIGTRLVLPSSDVMDICNDKWLTYQFMLSIGLEQPRSYIDESAAKAAILQGELSYPIIIKPRWGIGSFGVYIVENNDELSVFSSKLRRDITHTYMGIESAKDMNGCIIYQEKIDGQEYGVEILNDLDGNYVETFTLKKIAMRSGETDVAETVDAQPFVKTSKTISNNLHHVGVLDMDCMITSKGKIIVLEMNCRFGGQYPFTHLAGVNIPMQIISWLQGRGNCERLLTQKNGIRSCKDLAPVLL